MSTSKATRPATRASLRPTADDLPVHPTIAGQIRALGGSAGSAGIAEDVLLRLIGAEPALAARAVRVASAPAFGHAGRVTSLSLALGILGKDHGCALASGVLRRQGLAAGESWSLLWVHAVHSAALAEALAEEIRYAAPEEAYLAGLLHDVGRSYLHLEAGERTFDILASGEPGSVRAQREREVFGITHCEMGAWLAKRWRLAPPLSTAIRLHHASPERIGRLSARERALIAIVATADHLAHARRLNERSVPLPYAGFDPVAAIGIASKTIALTCETAERSLLEVTRSVGIAAQDVPGLYREAARARLAGESDSDTSREMPSLHSLNDVLHEVRRNASFAQVVDASLEALRMKLGFDRALYLERTRTGRTYRTVRVVDGTREGTKALLRLSPDREGTALAKCVDTRRGQLARKARADREILDHFGITEMGLAPVVSRGQVMGIFAVDNFAHGTPISERELALLELVAGEAGLLHDNFALQSQGKLLKEFAEKDEITGISNRRYAIELSRKEVERARRYGTALSLVMLDLDDFKELNDRYGHLAGDRVLAEVARILSSNSRRTDVLGRYGGDEFMALLPEIGRDQALHYAERMRAKVEEFSLALRPEFPKVDLSISIGVSTLQPGSKLEELIQAADRALYAAKEAGKNRVCLTN